jgi:hypothetical protein
MNPRTGAIQNAVHFLARKNKYAGRPKKKVPA